ncbi:uncharacterized protein LOC120188878 [Hibiscus syriacus]|uniref:uncharacterized protein LOC120188878 n=1 Tax=Hibiscus syriacus TaxID=106335 RepID=UPI0019247CF7|nr:uncharacterized protein LOC120188878 [Hibiscus syriacus]
MNKLGNFANIFSQSLCTRPGFDGRRFSTWATEGKKKIVSRLVPGNHDSMDKYDGWREEFEAPFLLQLKQDKKHKYSEWLPDLQLRLSQRTAIEEEEEEDNNNEPLQSPQGN